MFVLTNAWHAVTRGWAISALTMVVALLVSFGTIASLAILQEDSDAHGADYNAQTPNAVLRPTAKTAAAMKADDAKSSTSKYLKFTDYNPYAIAAQEKSVSFTYSFTETLPVRQSDTIKAIPGSSDVSADKTGGEFQLRSFYDAKAAKANDYGTYKLVDGKGLVFTDTKAIGALISKSVADKNGLKVGDTFKVGDPTDTSKTYEFKVRGIYEYTGEATANGITSDGSATLAKENRENVIYTAYATAYTFGLDPDSPKADTWSVPDLNVIFDFTDVDTYNQFVKLVKKAKLPDGYEITSPSMAAYEQSIQPLDSLAGKVRPAAWAIAIGGVVVLLALTIARTWFGRTDEIGLAFVSGVGKGRLGWQFMVETFMLTVIPIAIGLVAGGFGVKSIGAALAGGHATPVTSTIVWTLVWNSLGLVVVLAIVAMLKVATFNYAKLFAPVTYDDAVVSDFGAGDSATNKEAKA